MTTLRHRDPGINQARAGGFLPESKGRGDHQRGEIDQPACPNHVAGKVPPGDYPRHPHDAPAGEPEQQEAKGQPRPAPAVDERRRHQAKTHRGVTAGKRRFVLAAPPDPNRQRLALASERDNGVGSGATPVGLQHSVDDDAGPNDQQQAIEQSFVAPAGQLLRPAETRHPYQQPPTTHHKARVDSPIV